MNKEFRIEISKAGKMSAKWFILPFTVLTIILFIVFFNRFDFSFFTKIKEIGLLVWFLQYLLWMFGFFAAIFIGIVLHEGIHGLFIFIFAKGNRKALSFGFDKKTSTPYAHSKIPLRAWQMVVVCLMPLIILGIIPFFWAVSTGNVLLFIFGYIFVIAGGGDVLYSYFLLSKVSPNTMTQDLPDAVGFRYQ